MQRVSLCAFRRNIRTRARLSHYIQLFLGKIVQIYTHVLIILNTIDYAKGQPVCIQTKHQDTSQTFPLHSVIFRKNCTNIYPCTNNIKYDSSGHEPDFMQRVSLCPFRRNIRPRARLSHYIQLFLGKIEQIYTHVLIILNTIVYAKGQPVCIQTKHQATPRARVSHYIQLFLGKIVQIYTHVLIILNTIVYAKGQPVCIQTKHQDTSQAFPLHLVIFRIKQYKYIPMCTNNIKYDSLCKGSACVHSDETSGHEPDFPVTFSYFQEKQYKYIHMY